MPSFDELQGDKKVDVCIIGGGMAGILTAYMLKKRGVDCLLLEKGRICRGTTGHTTGKITAGQGLIYSRLLARYGKETAFGFYFANNEAIQTLRGISEDFMCDFETKDNYIYSLCDRGKIEDEVSALESIGAPVFFKKNIELPFTISGAVGLPNQAQFNPLLFLGSIARDIEIYENSFVREVKENRVVTDKGSVKANAIVIATHFPFINRKGLFFLKLYQHRSYVLTLENAPKLNGMYLDEAEGGLSFRDYREYLLLGGGGHRTGKGGGCFSAVREAKERYYPDAREKYAFATQACISLDGMPYIGRYSLGSSDMYVATGFNKWGMCGSTVAARLLSDEITGVKNDISPIFSPSRTMLHSQLALNAAESVLGLVYPTARRCSHLGCALHWNRAEHSWDCACHGSRYTLSGRLIDNPSQKDANV